MAEELAVRSGEVTEMDAYQQALALQRSPDIVMGEAAKAAAALKSVLDSKPKPVMMNGERYLEFEDWMLCGRFYGYTAKEDGDPEFVTMGEAQGFKASAVVLNRHGQVVSRATAYCMNDEDKWSTRTKYAYCYVLKDGSVSVDDPGASNMQWEDNPSKPGKQRPVKVKTKIGDEKVPLFQLSSMAQTRACSKALRNVLAWVVVMAGYKPTPAEELQVEPEHATHEKELEIKQPPSPKTPPPSPPAQRAAQEVKRDSAKGLSITGVIKKVDQKDTASGKKMGLVHIEGQKDAFTTFNTDTISDLDALQDRTVTIQYAVNGKYKNIVSFSIPIERVNPPLWSGGDPGPEPPIDDPNVPY